MSKDINTRELSERDLLIELKTEVGFIKNQLILINEKINNGETENGVLSTRITRLEENVRENSSFRKLTYTAIGGVVLELILTGVYIIFNWPQ